MATVPRLSGATVDPTIAQGGEMRAYDHGQQAVAQGMGNLAQAIGQIAQQQRQQEDESALMAYENALVSERDALLTDPQRGALNRKGADAIGLSTKVVPEFERYAGQQIDRMPTRLRVQAAQLRERHGQMLRRGLAQHELTESDAFHAEQANTGLALAVDEAIAFRADPERRDEAMARGLVYATTEWKRLGLGEQHQHRLRRDLVSGMYRRIIDATSATDPVDAERMLGQWRGRLTATDALEIEASLRPAIAERDGRAIAEQLFTTGAAAAPGGLWDGDVTRIKPAASLAEMDAEARRKLPYNAPELDAYAAHVEQQMGLPPGLLNALKNAGERSNSWQTSPAGAQGVMQFMPATGKQYGLNDPGDPVASIEASGRYMRDLLRQYGNAEAAIAHYNGGGKAAQAVLAGKAPPAQETRDYLSRVTGALGGGESRAVTARPGKGASVAELLLALPPNLPPAERQAAEQHLRVLSAARESQQARADQAMAGAIYAKAAEIPPTQPLVMSLSAAERHYLAQNSEVRNSIDNYRRLVASGSVIQDDPVVVDKLYRLRAEDPGAFAAYPLASHAHELSGATLASFTDDQRSATKPGKETEWATEAQVMDLAMAELGMAGDSKAQGEFKLAFYREKRAFVVEKKREPNSDELQVIMNRLKLPFARRTWWGSEATRRGYQGPAAGYSVPAANRTQIVQALTAAGIGAPTEEQILAVYLETEDSRL